MLAWWQKHSTSALACYTVSAMQCFFCPNPAAHTATGCEYAPGVLACSYCVRDFWTWVRGRVTVQRRPERDKRGRVNADFATAAAKFNPALGPVPHVVPVAARAGVAVAVRGSRPQAGGGGVEPRPDGRAHARSL